MALTAHASNQTYSQSIQSLSVWVFFRS